MTVELKTLYKDERGAYKSGATVEIPESRARMLIENGLAIQIERKPRKKQIIEDILDEEGE